MHSQLTPLDLLTDTQPVAPGVPMGQAGLASEHALLRFVLEELPVGLCVFGADDRLRFSNQRYLQIWSLPAELGAPGTRFADIMAQTRGLETERSRSQPQPEPGSQGTRRREWQLHNGRIIEVVVARLPDGSCVALHEDVTEQREASARVAYLAMHDMLTGLPNRVRLREEIEHQLKRHGRGEGLAVMCLDLDRFKPVNDSFGHPVGDALLKQVAQRLRACARETDLVARLGGDEFAIVQCGGAQPAAATALARRIIDDLSRSFHLERHEVQISVSVGIAVAPFDGDDPDTLQQNADLALYRAKADGRATLRFYEPALNAIARTRHGLEADLRRALEQGEFELLYQAQVDISDQTVSGFEALLRWNHPVRGRVSPLDFIALAEETGLIVPIGRWVLAQACQEATRWPTPVRVAVNVSAMQFRHGSLLRDVENALAASGLDPNRLEIEITESVILDDNAQAVALLHELHERGVRVAMDDFGTGYSSLSLLRSFPFDRIKIDRSFVRDADTSADALSIIRAVLGLGRSLGMSTTVEGVETAAQLLAMQAEGCTEVQGYFFSRPGPAADVPQLMTVAALRLAAAKREEKEPCLNASFT
jgi:diguanylate cyclase (GGDEF)-like protein